MSTENQNGQSTDTELARTAVKIVRRSGNGLVWLGVLLALAATGLSVVNYRNLENLQADTTAGDLIRQQGTRLDTLQTSLDALGQQQADIQSNQKNLELAQQANVQTLHDLATNMVIDNLDLALAETEQLIVMATQNLVLEGDVKTALAALEAAEDRLNSIEQPELSDTRTQLTTDINALRSVKLVDTAALSLDIATLLEQLNDLPLNKVPVLEAAADEPVVDAALPAWKRLLQSIWQEFRSLFIVTRTGSSGRATLLPDETWFLYQNLRLQLETARLSLMRHDTANLHAAMQSITSWVQDYFDLADTRVSTLLQTTGSLSAVELSPALPDISYSLETLRAYVRTRDMSDGSAVPVVP